MDPNTRALMMGAAGAPSDPNNPLNLTIGQSFQGGFFAGYISHTANGVPTHALIVAPAASGYNGKVQLQWKTDRTSTTSTDSTFDGLANSNNMNNPSHPAAQYCRALSIGGYSDWYLPARHELDIAYYNLKPDSTSNATGSGANSYSVPLRGSNYTTSSPGRTSVSSFQGGQAEAFVASPHQSSTQANASTAWQISFSDGLLNNDFKDSSYYVRAFRRISV